MFCKIPEICISNNVQPHLFCKTWRLHTMFEKVKASFITKETLSFNNGGKYSLCKYDNALCNHGKVPVSTHCVPRMHLAVTFRGYVGGETFDDWKNRWKASLFSRSQPRNYNLTSLNWTSALGQCPPLSQRSYFITSLKWNKFRYHVAPPFSRHEDFIFL